MFGPKIPFWPFGSPKKIFLIFNFKEFKYPINTNSHIKSLYQNIDQKIKNHSTIIKMISLSCLKSICQFISLSIVTYSSFISTLFCFILKSNPPAQGAEDQLKTAMYVFLGIMYALDIGKKIVIMKAKQLKTRFKYDVISNGLKMIVQLFLGTSILMTEHNINKVIYAISFFTLIGLIILRMIYVCCFSWRLRRKLKAEDYDDQEFVTYKLSLSSTTEIKEWMKNSRKGSLLETDDS